MRLQPAFPPRLIAVVTLLIAAGPCLAVDVGSGAPNDGITQRFLNAYFRNNFFNLVSVPPIAEHPDSPHL